MEEPPSDGLWTRAAKVNSRRIQGTTTYGKWRWMVEGRGPAFNGVHMQVFYLGGETLEQAQRLAVELGQLPDAEDKTDKAHRLLSK